MIGPRCEGGRNEQGCETRGARETRETSEWRASDTKRGSCTGSARADLTQEIPSSPFTVLLLSNYCESPRYALKVGCIPGKKADQMSSMKPCRVIV